MKSDVWLRALDKRTSTEAVGAKALNLLKLKALGYRVPKTYVLTYEVHDSYRRMPEQTVARLREELSSLPAAAYAVRSSASVEDDAQRSYAGQFTSHINVEGADCLVESVLSVWSSLDAPMAAGYATRHGRSTEQVRMSVMVQEMVDARVSGVVFSRNHITGLRETVVEAVHGAGTALMQDGVTPLRWTYHGGRFLDSPADISVPTETIEEVVRSARAIAKQTRADVDLEWVWDGHSLHWVQMREITTLREVHLYSNRISREMLAGQIKPLIWSVNIPLINGVWIDLMTQLTGPNNLTPHDLARAFHYRAYFNMGLLGEVFTGLGFPAESLEIMWGFAPRQGATTSFRPGMNSLRLIPRILRFALKLRRLPGLLEERIPVLEEYFRNVELEGLDGKQPEVLLQELSELYEVMLEAAYYNVVGPLSHAIYTHLLRVRLAKSGVDLSLLDTGTSNPAVRRFNPATYLDQLQSTFRHLPAHLQEAALAAHPTQGTDDTYLGRYLEMFNQFIRDFGHLSDSGNDFSTTPWREELERVARLVVDHVPVEQSKHKKPRLDEINLPWRGRRTTHWLAFKASQYGVFREQISYVYTFGYGLFRPYYRALGRHFVKQGWLETADDVFFLTREEIAGAVTGSVETTGCLSLALARKTEMEAVRDYTLPDFIYGTEPPPPEMPEARKLQGTATSRGYCEGPTRVVNGLHDFHKVQQGDVIVIPFSEVSWTPLFSRAVGVIAESGGMLSHSSIVAREYGIPAVVSVPGAMQLDDDIMVRLDGYRGEVTLLNHNQGEMQTGGEQYDSSRGH